MSSLLWKEWHEQRWKLGFGCLILATFALVGLHSRAVADETLMEWVAFLGIALLPVLSSTGLVPAERADGSLESLLALPVPTSRILAAKTLVGILLCVGPLMAAAVVSLGIASGREMTADAIISHYARSAAATVSLFVWMLALTIRMAGEARAGLLSLGVLIFWSLASMGFAGSPAISRLWAVSPFFFAFGTVSPRSNTPPILVPMAAALAVQGVIAAVLWWWAAVQLGRNTGSAEGRS
ncbi:MAG TPA: ABC transporter permease [Tepidisphaeraceae bacterium]|jgi:ABC-type transport system involved in multi-copper enzyme maturation permease subunit|nr:ABC transporter permease [Tepidisphaeraceae bacterium]